jgi:hypothetical protein
MKLLSSFSETVSVHPCGLLGQEQSNGKGNFSSALFRVWKNGFLQVGNF